MRATPEKCIQDLMSVVAAVSEWIINTDTCTGTTVVVKEHVITNKWLKQ
jgi:hypothetical protein